MPSPETNPEKYEVLSLEDFQYAVDNIYRFQFAKSMRYIPHWYTVRDWIEKDEGLNALFTKLVATIFAKGYVANFGKRQFTYLNVNGMQYWTMGLVGYEATTVLNKARVKQEHDYDKVADKYDSFFESEEYVEEDILTMGLLGDLPGFTLDIGCGTGMLLKYKNIPESKYLGIDPSRGMLKRLVKTHPTYKTQVRCVGLEDFVWKARFDNVVDFFGASYIGDLSLFTKFWNGDGKLFLMFFDEQYKPVTHHNAGMEIPYFRFSKAQLEDYFEVGVIEIENYYIVKK